MSATILLLSGGRSKRMGQDKSHLTYQGGTLLNWQVNRFEHAGYNVIYGLKDRFPDYMGPLAGIDAALSMHSEVDSWLIVPVDMPQISISALQFLAYEGQITNKPACFNNSPLPLYLPNSDEVTHALSTWLADPEGKRSVFALMHYLDGLWVKDTDFPNELNNINTPDQWQTFIEGALAE